MNAGMAGIVFSSIVLGVLVLSLVFTTRWNLLIKIAGVLSVVLFYHITVKSYPDLMGWPTSIRLPDRFNLEGVLFEEPNKSTQTRGKIFVWVTDLHDYKNPVPRAYVLPYTADLHTRLYDAGQKLRKRIPQLGEVVMVRNPVTAKEEIDLQFYDMPDILMPR